MVDYALEVAGEEVDEEVVEELLDKRGRVLDQLRDLEAEVKPIFKIFNDEEVQEKLQQSKDHSTLATDLEKNHGYRPA